MEKGGRKCGKIRGENLLSILNILVDLLRCLDEDILYAITSAREKKC